MNNKNIRWKQRFVNLEKAHKQLQDGLALQSPSELEKEGIIQRFEYTFELAWKTLKDFLESQGIEVKFPRDVIKEAFNTELILDGELWIEMLDNRNLLAHTYDKKQANLAFQKVASSYSTALKELYLNLKNK